MTVEHTLPSSIVPLLGSSYGTFRPGQVITRGDAGPIISRDWFEYNLRKYHLDLAVIDSSTDLRRYEIFWHHVRSGGLPFWIKEVESSTHRWLLCGPLADGSQTSFPLPVVGGSGVLVFSGGAIQDSSAYTVHTAANLLSDNMARFSTSTTGWSARGTCSLSRVTGISQSGLASCKVDLSSSQSGVGITTNSSYRTAIDASQEYTAVASIRGAGTFNIGICFYTSGGASLPTGTPSNDRTFSSNYTGSTTAWTQMAVTDTSEATAATCEIIVNRTTASANDYYVDCVGLIPGDLERWHLPSVSPGVIEFGSAPTANTRITATATGYRLCRVRTESNEPMWTFAYGSSVRPSRMMLVEDIEV